MGKTLICMKVLQYKSLRPLTVFDCRIRVILHFNNPVSICGNINSQKNESLPSDFRRKSLDDNGLDYDFAHSRWCEYLKRYANIKMKY